MKITNNNALVVVKEEGKAMVKLRAPATKAMSIDTAHSADVIIECRNCHHHQFEPERKSNIIVGRRRGGIARRLIKGFFFLMAIPVIIELVPVLLRCIAVAGRLFPVLVVIIVLFLLTGDSDR